MQDDAHSGWKGSRVKMLWTDFITPATPALITIHLVSLMPLLTYNGKKTYKIPTLKAIATLTFSAFFMFSPMMTFQGSAARTKSVRAEYTAERTSQNPPQRTGR